MENRPRGRETHVTDRSRGVQRRGSGLGTGPVGSGSGGFQSGGSSAPARSNFGKLPIIIAILAALLGGGGGLTALLGGGGETAQPAQPAPAVSTVLGGSFGGSSSASSGWDRTPNTARLDPTVAPAAREKFTTIYGDGTDTVTIMLYLCGTDLESKSGMATADLQEMLAARSSDRVNLLIYTGGCTGWRNSVVSSAVNQIYQVRDGKLACLVPDAGSASMTKPETLSSFIQWCAKNYPANRNELIFWDHGGGSLTGYGYDQKYPKSGSMTLAGIRDALEAAGQKFDCIGFDACLMATLETALMAADYADYLIASEETEPGVGWYYTNWLTELAADPGKPTIEIGQRIVDDFVDVCAQKCRGQQTTLSVTDLAELSATAPAALRSFAVDTNQLIQAESYQTVSHARAGAREFARSSAIDQVDLVHLASGMGTGEALIDAVLGAVKYNRTASSMTNAYGLSIYFPYQKAGNVDRAVDTYRAIGMDDDYARCIQEFASLEVSGQAAAGGTGSPLPSLLGTLGSSAPDLDTIGQLLGGLLGAGGRTVGLDSSNSAFLQGRALSADDAAAYIGTHQLDPSQLQWTRSGEGWAMSLPEAQWSLVQELELNCFYDDGAGYIDLGLDSVFTFDETGALLAPTDRTWLAIDGQPVAYYHLSTVDDGENYTIMGRVPALRNGERVDLILVFDNANPYGTVAGISYDYVDGETETAPKLLPGLEDGDVLEFLCDYYTYDGVYQDTYYLGDPLRVTADPEISNVDVGDGPVRLTYRLTDLYNHHLWTPAITLE